MVVKEHNCNNLSVSEPFGVGCISNTWYIFGEESCSKPINYCPYCGLRLTLTTPSDSEEKETG